MNKLVDRIKSLQANDISATTPVYTKNKIFKSYGIDEFGNIYNKYGNKLKWNVVSNGYARVYLCSKECSRTFAVHRLVMYNFGPLYIYPNTVKPQINHIDGNKLNNHISNLEWCTQSENLKHAYLLGLKNSKFGEDSPNCKFSNEVVWSICHDIWIRKLPDKFIASTHGCSVMLVNRIRHLQIRRKQVEAFLQFHEIKY